MSQSGSPADDGAAGAEHAEDISQSRSANQVQDEPLPSSRHDDKGQEAAGQNQGAISGHEGHGTNDAGSSAG